MPFYNTANGAALNGSWIRIRIGVKTRAVDPDALNPDTDPDTDPVFQVNSDPDTDPGL